MSLERERSPQRAYVARKIDEGRISFENVSFAYPNAPGKALDKVSFKIEAGERIGIIGRVGSGKTTVGRLLLGFYEAEEGRILVDGVDSRQYDPADLRAGIGFAMQDTDLFFGKLRDNIALGKPEATDEEVLAAARLVRRRELYRRPSAWDTTCRLPRAAAVCRAARNRLSGWPACSSGSPACCSWTSPPRISTCAAKLSSWSASRPCAESEMTIIISTHRLSLLGMVDRLLLFDNGRLVADGPRDKVLALLQGKPAAAATEPAAQPNVAPRATLVQKPNAGI